MAMRINKFLSSQGLCSRREADRWVQEGRITLNGRVAVLGDLVPEGAELCLDGKVLEIKKNKEQIILAFNKPEGVESTQDPLNPRNVDRALNYSGPRVFLIGRLDIGSEGLLLMTNDGDLVNPILRSQGQHEKEYVVVYRESVSDEQIRKMSQGVDIGDELRGPTKPCRIERAGSNRLKIILTEGRNRQIRRMAEAVGLYVVRLKRIRVMNIHLGELKSGEWRHLNENEKAELLARLGF
jgi:23S rRNA pseudouridine2604 synthase